MFWRRKKRNDFAAEIESHLQLEADRHTHEGRSEEEARDIARRAFGNVTRAREHFYESRRWRLWDVVMQDLRFGARILVKSPASTCIAILTLALGIGANTAIFSLVNAVLLRALPVSRPNQLVLFGKGEWVGSQDTLPDRNWQLFSYPFYREFRQKNHVFAGVAAVDSILFESHGRVGSGREPEKINVELVSGSYFLTLGVNPAAGRVLTGADDRTPGAHPVAVASYSWWRRRFAQSPTVLGTTATINGTVYSIVGVAPPGFYGATLGQSPDLWIPLAMEKQISPGWNGLEDKLFQSLYIIARLKPGIGISQASADTNLLFKQILYEYAGPKPTAKQLESIRHAGIQLTGAAGGLPGLRIGFSTPLKILMALVALVLLIACANVANLLLARAVARQREIAVRMSIGADRRRLIRQLLVESGLLGFSGAALGAFFAWATNHFLLAMVFPPGQPLPIDVAPDAQVLGFALAVTLVTVLVFGTAPALYATRIELASSLKDGRGVLPPARNRLSRILVVAQMALSLMLLVGAGLFLRNLANLMNVDTGFDKRNVLVIGVDPGAAGYRVDARLENMMERIEERVSSVPGIDGASFAFLVFGGGWTGPVRVSGRPISDHDPDVDHNIVGAQYLATMRMPIVLGRTLSPHDNAASRKVAVINETMARTYFPGGSPIGRTFSNGPEPEWQNAEVVGVAKDAKYMNLRERPMPAAFYPHAQHGMFLYNFVVHCAGNAASTLPEIRRAIHGIEPNLPVGHATRLEDQVNDSVRNQRLIAQLSTSFGILAVVLACIGIYGVVSYGVTRRTNEFGIRAALGADHRHLLWSVLRDILRLVLAGTILGLILAIAASRFVQSQLFGLKSYDPLALAVAFIAMFTIALFAAYIPARRATRIDPMTALRFE